MKSRRKTATYYEGDEAADRFQRGLSRILSVSKEQLAIRKDQDRSRRYKDKPGPKPKNKP